jgi:hypothetical protein
MLSLGVETVLVGDVVDAVPDVGGWVNIAEATADNKALIFLAGVHQLSGFLTGLAVRQFIAELVSIDTDVIQWSLLYEDGLAVLQAILRSSKSDGDNGGKGNDLEYK